VEDLEKKNAVSGGRRKSTAPKPNSNESPLWARHEFPGAHALKECNILSSPAVLLRFFPAQSVSHALLMGVGIQVAALVFLSAAAPADIVTAQVFFLSSLFLIIEKSFQKFHLYLHRFRMNLPIATCIPKSAIYHAGRRAALNLTWFRAHSAIELISAASSAPTASEPAAAPAAAAFFFGPGLANRNGVAQKLPAAEPSDGFLGCFFGLHFHEPESSGNPRVPVLDDVYGDNFTHFGEVRFQILFGDLHGQISDVKILVHTGLPSFFIIPLSDLKRKIFKGFHPPKEIAFGIPHPSKKKPPLA
jgi:hypothetical protein